MSILDSLLHIVAPHACEGCGAEGAVVCLSCIQALPTLPSRCYRCSRSTESFRTCRNCRSRTSIARLYSAALYSGVAKSIVQRLKFERAMAAANDMAAALAYRLPCDEWIVTHVPTASRRVRVRGYDQAALIARTLARQRGLPYFSLLARTTETRQVGQKKTTRQEQMAAAFQAIRPRLFQNKRVLLVDDVITTGATLEAAARTLRDAGADEVSAAVFAVA